MSDPKRCGEATWIDGVPICRLEILPCYAMDECALKKHDEFLSFMRELAKGEKKNDE